MIHIVGEQDTPEHAAAVELRGMIARVWPDVLASPEHDIWVVVGAKCHGQEVRDIDILLLASLGPGIHYTPFLSFESNGRIYTPRAIEIRTLCLVIEVKDHPPERVRFIGTDAEVEYRGKWHNSSQKNFRQIFSVKNYLEYQGIRAPRITSLLWLRNIPSSSLPPRPHPILGASVTWELMLNVVAQLTPPHREDDRWVISTGPDPSCLRQAADVFTKTLTPTRLDRQRMERITKQTSDLSTIRTSVGHKMVILRGRGGTGKTMRLLQLANSLDEEEGARVLILTYNKALVADIRRMLTIMGIGDDLTDRAIHIQTVHSFMHAVLTGLELIDETCDFLSIYESAKDQAIEYLRSGVLVPADIERLLSGNVEAFRWDYVFIDEAQDWPANESTILLALYRSAQIVIADGIEQLVRSNTPADWRNAVKQGERYIAPLKKSLRMKAGLARFVSAVARYMNLPLEWEANPEIPGGRVIVVDGPYLNDRTLQDLLIKNNDDDGNAPVDMLFCVPPTLVLHHRDGTPSRSVVAARFIEWGFSTWDGAVDSVRESYPTEIDQLRIVQYESCRGLEGWIVVNLGLDTLYEMKRTAFYTLLNGSDAEDQGPTNGDPSPAHLFASRWLCIPLTRAMDTLVIQLEHKHSPVRRALDAAAKECGDYVQWVQTS